MNRKHNLKEIDNALSNVLNAKKLAHHADRDIIDYKIEELFAAVNGIVKDIEFQIKSEK